MDVMIELRSRVIGEIFDYQLLMYVLREYKKPRDKISLLISNGSIIQIKKGIYVFGSPYRRGLLSLEIAAAMLVQPSYISREYALFQYSFLPERVKRVTSMTTRKKKSFETPIGSFDYYSLNAEKFGIGVEVKKVTNEGSYLLATKEKAMVDWLASLPNMTDKEILTFFLFEESRIERELIKTLDKTLLAQICKIYKNQNADLLLKL